MDTLSGEHFTRINELVSPNAGQKFKGNDFRDLCKPGVYLYMRGSEALYVGMGKSVMTRASSSGTQYGRQLAIADCDLVLLYPCVSVKAALELEMLMIGKMKPKYNVNKNMYASKVLGVRSASLQK